MCVLRTHIKLYIFEKFFSKIEKIVNTFSILKIFFFQKWKLLYTLKVHINKILKLFLQYNYSQLWHSGPTSTTLCLNSQVKDKVGEDE